MASESAPVLSRPVTSKSRGICKYYNTERGCFAPAGKCKFLHGPDAIHTPYDQAKICRFYAAGFCKRGAKCWFIHTKGKEKAVDTDEEDDLCSICFDKPDTYGLLTDCSHIFCITCIKQWRDPANKSIDVVDSGNTKRCPMCRGSSKFIIPSSKFYAQGEAKDAALARYMDSMKRVPCKHFQKSLASNRATPFCPFGKDCFYQHRNPDGTDYISTQGIDDARMRAQRQFGLPELHRAGLIRQLESVFTQSASLGWGPRFPNLFDEGLDNSASIQRRLEILADQMLASLAAQDPHSESEGPSDDEDEAMPPLERVDAPRAQNRVLPSGFDSDTDGEMPALASVSDSSDSASASDDEEDDEDDNYSNTLETGDAPFDRMQTIRPFDLVFDPGMDERDAADNRDVFMRLRSFLDDISRSDPGPSTSTSAPESSTSTRAVNTPTADPPVPLDARAEEEGDADDEFDMPPLEREPPFVTDGRGRVVWSSSSDSAAGQQADSSGPRRASVSFPGAFPPASSAVEKLPSPRQTTTTGEGGFTTDGRGRVIGTTGTREDAEDSGSGTTEEAPVHARGFFGRVLDAFF
ncbi:hypothetical protein C8R45DRAFT_1065588 [Mycena sanguinolenta]|nr:hypothetical protein C8R45DRAFT_1065588 [Mycena sanguinolenta]